MNVLPTHCPNPECENHQGTSERFFWKKGTFKPKCKGYESLPNLTGTTRTGVAPAVSSTPKCAKCSRPCASAG